MEKGFEDAGEKGQWKNGGKVEGCQGKKGEIKDDLKKVGKKID